MLGRCERTVFKVCTLFTDRSREQVEELYQEIVTSLWDSYSNFRHESAESTWIYRVSLNTAINWKRSRRKAPQMVWLDETTYHSLEQDTHSELLDRLYTLIDRLEPHEKEMVFYYLNEVPQKEVARIKRCTERTVRNKMQAIINKLIKMNENED